MNKQTFLKEIANIDGLYLPRKLIYLFLTLNIKV